MTGGANQVILSQDSRTLAKNAEPNFRIAIKYFVLKF